MGKSNQNFYFSEAIYLNKNYIAKQLSFGLLIFKLILILPDSVIGQWRLFFHVCTSFIFCNKIRIHCRRKHFESLEWVNILAESAWEIFFIDICDPLGKISEMCLNPTSQGLQFEIHIPIRITQESVESLVLVDASLNPKRISFLCPVSSSICADTWIIQSSFAKWEE